MQIYPNRTIDGTPETPRKEKIRRNLREVLLSWEKQMIISVVFFNLTRMNSTKGFTSNHYRFLVHKSILFHLLILIDMNYFIVPKSNILDLILQDMFLLTKGLKL